MTPGRWRWECAAVRQWFPLFRPFYTSTHIGFEGVIGRSGILYEVRLEQRIELYPAVQPDVFVHPCPTRYRMPGGSMNIYCRWRPNSPPCSFAWLILLVADAVNTVDESELDRRNVSAEKI
jgi:hypothetical protein